MDTGVYRWGYLLKRAPQIELRHAVADGTLIRLRRGWYSIASADRQVEHAVRSGGVLSCASALRLHSVWVPRSDRVHIRGNDGAARSHPGWCRQSGRQPPEFEAVDDLLTALRHAAQCLPPEDFIVVCDSIINLGLMTHSDLTAEFAGRSRFADRVLSKIDGRAESGIETMVRLRLKSARIPANPQVNIPMVGRVDFLVGTSLIIEVDGAEFHQNRDAYENDRLRDLQAHAFGYHPVRLTYEQVVYQWHAVFPLIVELIRRGEHMRRVEVSPLDTTLT
ncbi:endonuclease domain-containing protein [Gordonia sp. HY002]|uniref:DUF559 domain-containing protein n=1 Tax=Gordonia zhenghanii TaxID=2911516 RepID=UPI001EF09C36|nr:DUF559 domain-containing protein [Gordonia zhenghanii]MCF8572075.1 endonuclease domain-containing protein [Gordonia zhenghanii]MCF8602949.1 endonuclease domain-containing protein [Gordonia zhenghanii]MCF8605679.1 endonuclease domain-containing protein [Gordonia zhenghanii]